MDINLPNDYIKIVNKDSNLPTLIAFSSVNTKKGSFKPYKLFFNLPYNIIFLNCSNNSWYLEGIEGLSNDYEECAKKIVLLAKKIGNGKVYSIGTSMGAFGAILYTCIGNADACIAFGTETVLDIEGSRSFIHRKIKYKDFFDLREIINKNPVPILLFFPENDEIDLFNAILLKGFQNIQFFPIKGIEHPSIQFIESESELYNIIQEFSNSYKISFSKKRYSEIFKNNEFLDYLQGVIFMKKNINPPSLIEYLNITKNNHPESSYVNLILGNLHQKMGELKKSEKYWLKAIELDEYQFEAYGKLTNYYCKLNKFVIAEELGTKAININPFNAFLHHNLALLYIKTNNYKKGLYYANNACNINKGNKKFKETITLINNHIDNAPK